MLLTINDYIKQSPRFNGNKSAFARHIGVSKQYLNVCTKQGCMIVCEVSGADNNDTITYNGVRLVRPLSTVTEYFDTTGRPAKTIYKLVKSIPQ